MAAQILLNPVSTEEQDVTAQRDALAALGVEPERIYVDRGFTGRNKNRAGLREALAACRAGDTFVVTKLDRLARSVRDAHEIADDLASREIKLNQKYRAIYGHLNKASIGRHPTRSILNLAQQQLLEEIDRRG